MPELVLVGIIGYLLGSIPVGYLVGKSRGIDVRRYGSGSTGGTNVLRTLGVGAAVFTGLCDLGKGILAGYLGQRVGGEWGYAAAGLLASLGHSYPVWLGFRGGKSVLTSLGVVVLTHPLAILVAAVAGIGSIISTRWVSLGSLVGTAVAAVWVWATGAPLSHRLLVLGLVLVIYVRHWENIKRIAAGTENKIGQKAKPRPEV